GGLQEVFAVSTTAGQRDRGAHEVLPALAEQLLQPYAVRIAPHATTSRRRQPRTTESEPRLPPSGFHPFRRSRRRRCPAMTSGRTIIAVAAPSRPAIRYVCHPESPSGPDKQYGWRWLSHGRRRPGGPRWRS